MAAAGLGEGAPAGHRLCADHDIGRWVLGDDLRGARHGGRGPDQRVDQHPGQGSPEDDLVERARIVGGDMQCRDVVGDSLGAAAPDVARRAGTEEVVGADPRQPRLNRDRCQPRGLGLSRPFARRHRSRLSPVAASHSAAQGCAGGPCRGSWPASAHGASWRYPTAPPIQPHHHELSPPAWNRGKGTLTYPSQPVSDRGAAQARSAESAGEKYGIRQASPERMTVRAILSTDHDIGPTAQRKCHNMARIVRLLSRTDA